MTKMRKTIAYLLAALTIATSADFGVLATAKAEERQLQDAEPAIKFEQSNFDEASSILSMDLMMKPQSTTVPGSEEWLYLTEGFFTLSYDMTNLTPVTDPALFNQYANDLEAIPAQQLFTEDNMIVMGANSSPTINGLINASDLVYSGRRAYPARSTLKLSNYIGAYEYIADYPFLYPTDTNNESQAYRLGDFGDWYPGAEAVSGILISSSRRRFGDEDSGEIAPKDENMVNMYVQFRFSTGIPINPQPDGYVKVMTLKFLVSAGFDANLEPIPSHSTDVLYKNSLTVPETSEEAEKILSQFHYTDSSGTRVDLPAGAAAFKEIKTIGDEEEGTDFTWPKTLMADTITYYYGAPKNTKWTAEGGGTAAARNWEAASGVTINQLDGKPLVTYDNSDRAYIVEEFHGGFENTYATDESADFVLPPNEVQTLEYPRYAVPRAEDDIEWDAEGQSWVPWVYQYHTQGSERIFDYKKRQPLKFDLGTIVSGASSEKPETSSVESRDRFLDSIDWNFTLSVDSTSLEDSRFIDVSSAAPEGDPYTIPTAQGEAIVQRMRVTAPATDPRNTNVANPYLDKLFQKVTYNQGLDNEYSLYTPLGTTIDLVESDIMVTHLGNPDEDLTETVRGKAPQLNMRSEAADARNILWTNLGSGSNTEGNGALYFSASYTDEFTGIKYDAATTYFRMQIYKAQNLASRIEINLSEFGTTFDPEKEETVTGFALSKNPDTGIVEDMIATGRTIINVRVFDQYGIAFVSPAGRPALTLEWLDDPETDPKKKRVLPLEIINDPSGDNTKYRLVYKSGKTINDVWLGNYSVRATLGTLTNDEEAVEGKSFFINKEANRLTYMKVSVPGSNATAGADGFKTATYSVPPPTQQGTARGSTQVSVTELANQWRNPNDISQVTKISEYDVVHGIRNIADDTDPANPVYRGNIDHDLAALRGVNIDIKLKIASESAHHSWTGIGIRTADGAITYGSDEWLQEDGYWHPRVDVDRDVLEITYDSRVQTGTVLEVIVSAEYDGKKLEDKYKLTLNRLAPVLSRVTLSAIDPVIVPTGLPDSPSPLSRNIRAVPYDQYGERMDWVFLDEQRNHTTYYLELDPAILATGISIASSYPTYIMSVDKAARNTIFKVRARITTNGVLNTQVMSDWAEVNIARATSYPRTVDNPRYRDLGVDWRPPDNNSSSNFFEYAVTNFPALIHDQYGDSITAAECGTIEWTIDSVSGDLKREELIIDALTGTIRVLRNAHNGKASIRLRIHDKSGMLRVNSTFYDYITIQRAVSTVQNISIVPNPTTDSSLPAFTLPYKQTATFGATGRNQYGDDISITLGMALWEIVASSVEFEGSPEVTSRITTIGVAGARVQTVYAVSGGTETRVMTLSEQGTLQFSEITNWDYVPKKMRIKVTSGTATEEKDFDIIFKPESTPTSIYVNQNNLYDNPIAVPAAGSTAVETREVTGDIRDQYGLILPNAQITWSLKEIRYTDESGDQVKPTVPFVTFGTSAGNATVSLTNVNSDAQTCEIVLLATYGGLTREVIINAVEAGQVAESMEIRDLITPAGTNAIYLQGFDVAEVVTGNLEARIFSQYSRVIGGTTKWEIDKIYYIDKQNGDAEGLYSGVGYSSIAEFSATTRNALLVKQSQAVIDQAVLGNPSFISVRGTVVADRVSNTPLLDSHGGVITVTKNIEIKLAAAKPIYSSIQFSDIKPKEYTGMTDDDGVGSLTMDAPQPNAQTPAQSPPWIYLPEKNGTNSFKVIGKVYDQYKREITAAGGANPAVNAGDDKVKISFAWRNIQGYTFDDSVEGEATVSLASTITQAYLSPYFSSTPLNNAQGRTDPAFTPSRRMMVLRSPTIPDQMMYYSAPDTPFANPILNLGVTAYEVPVPLWATVAEANVPTSPTSGLPLTGEMLTASYESSATARILNQYGSPYREEILITGWSLQASGAAEMYKGFTLVDAAGTQITADYKNTNVFMRVNNKTLSVDELEREVAIIASAKARSSSSASALKYENYSIYPEMRKTAKVLLSKGRSNPSYLYVKGVDAAGVTGSLKRPHVSADGKTVGSVKKVIEPQIYDQYGYIVGGAADTTVDLDVEDVEIQGAAVEKIVTVGGTRQDPIEIITGYKIYDSELPEPEQPNQKVEDTRILLAEYIIESKELTIYSTCTLASFSFTATANDEISGILPKRVNVPIDNSEAIRPYRVELEGKNPREFIIKSGSTEIQEEIVATYLYDQYGNRIDPQNVRVIWKLKSKNPDGTYSDYRELIKDPDTGLEVAKPLDEYLVTLAHGPTESPQPAASSRYTIIRVKPEFFEKDIELYLEATVLGAGSVPYNPNVSVMNTIQIKREKKGGGDPPPLPPPAYYQVTFSGGEYGITVGKNFETILGGEMVKNTPGIKNEEGWAFDGWSVLGEKIKIDEYPILDNIEMVATYRSIKQFAFIGGYGDTTVRPSAEVTRAEFIKMIAVGLGDYDPNMNYIDMYGRKFSDVPNNAWYANYVAYGSHRGFFGGYEDGTFRPDKPIRRDEASKIIYMAIPELVSSVEKGDLDIDEIFSDIEYGDWFAEFVEALYYLKIIGGYEDATFRPANHVSRAEAVKMIVLITEIAPTNEDLSRIKQYIDSPFSDLKKDSWAYAYILRAAGIA